MLYAPLQIIPLNFAPEGDPVDLHDFRNLGLGAVHLLDAPGDLFLIICFQGRELPPLVEIHLEDWLLEIQWQVLHLDDAAVAQGHGPLRDVFRLNRRSLLYSAPRARLVS
jgi:hypothetical protein